MWRNQEEKCLTVSALGAVDRHAGYLRSFAAEFREKTQPIRTRSGPDHPNAGAHPPDTTAHLCRRVRSTACCG